MTDTIPVRLLIFIQIVFALQAAPAYSQNSYIIHHYTNENGLPANGVKGIELDKKNGFLWIGTQAGLVRFDGAHFTNFNSENSPAISRIALILKNREGVIFCEDDNFSLYRISGHNPEFVMTDTVFYPFHQSKRWQTLYQSVNYLKENLMKHKRSSFLPDGVVFHDESGDSSSFSFVHFGHAYHYSARKDSLYDFPGFKDILKIGRDVYFADSMLHLWRYSDSLKKPVQVQVSSMPAWKEKQGETPRLIWKQGMETPLFVWKQDIWKLQGQGNELYLSPLCDACIPPRANIDAVQLWEEQGIIFLSSDINGLYVVKKPFLHAIRADTTTEAGQAEYVQAEITPGIVTTATGLSFSAQGKLLPGEHKVSIPSIHTIYKDHQGDYWFHSGDTIIHFHPKEGRYTKIPLNDGSERMIFTEAQNRLYVFSDIAIADITGEQYRLLYKIPYAANEMKNWLNPDAVAEVKPGVLAIATEKLILFDTRKKAAPDTVPIPGLTAKVRALQQYGDYLMIGTYGQGFYLYKNGVVKKMPLDKNRYLSYAHCFMLDDQGYCWISTNHGLFKASMKALIAAYENDLHEIYYHYFGKNDGLFNTEFNGGCQPCALKLSSGLYSFPTMNGTVVFDPRLPHTPPPTGQLFIDEIEVDSMSYQITDDALHALPYDAKNMRFKLSLPQFGNPENIYFSYKLEPYNDKWETQDITQNSVLLFGGLKPGVYTLHVRIRNGFEPDAFGVKEFRFRILAPWYQSWWFYSLCLLGFIALTWLLVKWRTATINRRKKELQQLVATQTKNLAAQSRQLSKQLQQLQNQQSRLEEDNRIKARLIAIISHDLISPLKFMAFIGRKLRDGQPSEVGFYETANFIVKVAQELEFLSFNMLNWIRFHHESLEMRPETFNLHELVNESVQIASTLSKEKGIGFYIDVPEQTEVFQYRQAVSVIVYNLAMNAMKYTTAGEIRVASAQEPGYLLLSITDTGSGMDPKIVHRLNNLEPIVSGSTVSTTKFQFGYVIIKELLRLIHGSLLVESQPDKGTRVTIRLTLPGKNNEKD